MLQVKLLDAAAKAPTLAYDGDLGYDLYALTDTWIYTYPSVIKTGIACAAYRPMYPDLSRGAPLGLLIKDRSSMAQKGVFTHGGVIDAGYRGEITITMTTLNRSPYFISAGDKIAQMIPVLVLTNGVQVVDSLTETDRGEKGFGSSGR